MNETPHVPQPEIPPQTPPQPAAPPSSQPVPPPQSQTVPPEQPRSPIFAYAVPQPSSPPVLANRRDSVFRLLTILAAILFADFALWGQFNLGFAIATFAVTAVGVVYLLPRPMKLPPFALFCLVCALALSATFARTADAGTKLLCFAVILFLMGAFYCQSCGVTRYDFGTYQMAGDVLRTLFIIPLQFVAKPFQAIKQTKTGETKHSTGLKVLAGVLIALPVLLIVVPLLAQADAAFAGTLDKIGNNLFPWIVKIIVGLLLSLFLFSLFFALKKGLATQEPAADGSIYRQGVHFADPVVVNSFFGAIALFYLIYLFSQTAYFFTVFQGILPAGYSFNHSEYARRGFFEMSTIAGINLVLIFLGTLLVKRKEGKIPLSTRLFSAFICLFTLLLIGTALAKMGLYIDNSGLTRLRVVTSLFMVALCVCFVCVLVRLFLPRFPYAKVILAFSCLLLLGTAAVDIDTVIADYNVTAFEEGRLDHVDVSLLEELSDGAVPSLIQLLDSPNEEAAAQARTALWRRFQNRYEVNENGEAVPFHEKSFTQYNYAAHEADRLLRENYLRFQNADAEYDYSSPYFSRS